MRALYDGLGFEAIREGEAFRGRSFTTQYAAESPCMSPQHNGQPTGERYRWIEEEGSSNRQANESGYAEQTGRYGVRGATLYGNGGKKKHREAVWMNKAPDRSARQRLTRRENAKARTAKRYEA